MTLFLQVEYNLERKLQQVSILYVQLSCWLTSALLSQEFQLFGATSCKWMSFLRCLCTLNFEDCVLTFCRLSINMYEVTIVTAHVHLVWRLPPCSLHAGMMPIRSLGRCCFCWENPLNSTFLLLFLPYFCYFGQIHMPPMFCNMVLIWILSPMFCNMSIYAIYVSYNFDYLHHEFNGTVRQGAPLRLVK